MAAQKMEAPAEKHKPGNDNLNIKPDIKEFKHFAIIQTAFLGDVALSLPLSSYIKKLNPESKISFVTTPQAAPIAGCSGDISHVISYDKRHEGKGLKGIKSVADNLRDIGVDCIIAPHRSLRTTLISYFAKPIYSVGFAKSALSIVYKHRIPYFPSLHETERNLLLLEGFNNILFNDLDKQITIPLIFSSEDRKFVDDILTGINSERLVTLAPGSVWETKRWPAEYFEQLATKLSNSGFKVLVLGSKSDENICDRIAGKSGAISLAGLTSLPQTIYLLSKCSLLITNDSAPTHLGELAGCPVITIFGPTHPIFGFAPRLKNSAVIQAEGMKCRPCAIHGSRKCPLGTHECMKRIVPEQVFDKAMEILNRNM